MRAGERGLRAREGETPSTACCCTGHAPSTAWPCHCAQRCQQWQQRRQRPGGRGPAKVRPGSGAGLGWFRGWAGLGVHKAGQGEAKAGGWVPSSVSFSTPPLLWHLRHPLPLTHTCTSGIPPPLTHTCTSGIPPHLTHTCTSGIPPPAYTHICTSGIPFPLHTHAQVHTFSHSPSLSHTYTCTHTHHPHPHPSLTHRLSTPRLTGSARVDPPLADLLPPPSTPHLLAGCHDGVHAYQVGACVCVTVCVCA